MKRIASCGILLVCGVLLASGCQPAASSSAAHDAARRTDTSATKRTSPSAGASAIVGQTSTADVGGGTDTGSPSGSVPAPSATSDLSATDAASTTRVRETTFDDLKFEMELGGEFQRSMLTPQIEEMLGQRIRIRGYILPTLRKKGLRQFVLVRDNMECCFGPGAALYDCILITMAPGETATYTIRPVAVEGVFDFEQHAPLGETLAIFKMTANAVE